MKKIILGLFIFFFGLNVLGQTYSKNGFRVGDKNSYVQVATVNDLQAGAGLPSGITADGVTDDAAAINAYLLSRGEDAVIQMPYGTYRVNSTINIQNGQKINWNKSWIRCGITNGDPLIYVAPEYMSWEISNLTIYSLNGVKRNFIGVSVGTGTSSDDSAPYGYLHDIKVYLATTGFYINGYTVDMNRLSTSHCGRGFVGYNNNNVSMNNFKLENDSIALSLNGGAEIFISNLLIQGIEKLLASNIDGVNNLQLRSLYVENNVPTDSYFMTIGTNKGCNNIVIDGVNIWNNTGTNPHLYIDNVNQIFLQGNFTTNTYAPGYVTTNRTRGLVLGLHSFNTVDNNNQLGNHYNYFPNSSFEAYLRGYTDVYLRNVTMTQEVSNTKSGNSAVRITCVNSTTYNEAEFEINAEAIPLRNKLVTVSAWIYVPAVSGYENSGSRTMFPNIVLKSRDGSSNVNNTDAYPNEYFQSGYWNFWSDTLTIQDDAIELWLVIYANQSSNSASSSNYIIVDDIQIVDGYVAKSDIVNRKYPDAEDISATIISGRMILTASSVPTDVHQTFAVGDQVWKITPTSGTAPGWICTTGGAGGTAVFTEMANLK